MQTKKLSLRLMLASLMMLVMGVTEARAETCEHTTDVNKFGICTTCGTMWSVPTFEVAIDNCQDMMDLAYAVSRGQDFRNTLIKLTDNIDFQQDGVDASQFLGIGTTDHPFSGTFDGNYRTIKNLVMQPTNTVPGLFSTVTGNVTIRNLILDTTCTLISTSWGAGGIVGCSRYNTELQLHNCGFEGYVEGYKNVGGILGGTFSQEGATINVTIDHCYNTGIVKGDTESASLCGYAANAVICNSWNTGEVTGYTTDHPLARGNYTLYNSYDVNAAAGEHYTTVERVASGELAFYLNDNISGYGADENISGAWYQEIGVDDHPTFVRNLNYLVYHHHYYWCDAPDMFGSYFDNKPLPETAVAYHDFDEKGICLRTAGEVHGEECPVVEDCWQVTKMGHMYYIAKQVNSGTEQHDINLLTDLVDNVSVVSNGELSADAEGFHQWTAIGTYNNPFRHKFEGNYHTISGLYTNPTEEPDRAGLFGLIKGNASISNVGVTDSYINNIKYAAGFIVAQANAEKDGAGNFTYPRVSHCYASDGVLETDWYSGGIMGYFEFDSFKAPAGFTAPIVDCYSTNPVASYFKEVEGGILGYALIHFGAEATANCYYLEGCTREKSNQTHGKAKSELAFRLGEVCQLLEEGLWSQSIDKHQSPVFGDGSVSYARKVTAGNWGSLVLPFPVTSDEKVQYYTCEKLLGEEKKAELHLNRASTVPANTPCFFRTSADCSELSLVAANSVETPTSSEVKVEVSSGDYGTTYLIGTYDAITVSPQDLITNYFVAQNKLWWGERAFNVAAYRAYLNVNYWPFDFAKSLSFVIDDDDETTGITTTIDAGQWNGKLLQNGKVVIVKNGVKYNAAGQRIL